jgi:hypothetical protein
MPFYRRIDGKTDEGRRTVEGLLGLRRALSEQIPRRLRSVRGWLEPWVMLWRYWRAFSDLPPLPELGALLERVSSGRGLYLYEIARRIARP